MGGPFSACSPDSNAPLWTFFTTTNHSTARAIPPDLKARRFPSYPGSFASLMHLTPWFRRALIEKVCPTRKPSAASTNPAALSLIQLWFERFFPLPKPKCPPSSLPPAPPSLLPYNAEQRETLPLNPASGIYLRGISVFFRLEITFVLVLFICILECVCSRII